MTPYVALLRAVNVGGTGKLPMTELAAMCEAAGFAHVRTYIASGNVVFTSALSESDVKGALETRLAAYAGKPVGVLVRTADEIDAVLATNPFAAADGFAPNRTVAIFLDDPPQADALAHARRRTTERLALGVREIYIAYDEGMGASRLTIPAAARGTARNMNTVARLAALAGALR
ncbi:MAG TPA: DUF1697 domain-containing protein [Gemmatirosa sp.]